MIYIGRLSHATSDIIFLHSSAQAPTLYCAMSAVISIVLFTLLRTRITNPCAGFMQQRRILATKLKANGNRSTRPFSYFFVDSNFDNLYRNEERNATIVTWFSALAIVIACLELWGLISFTVTQKITENKGDRHPQSPGILSA